MYDATAVLITFVYLMVGLILIMLINRGNKDIGMAEPTLFAIFLWAFFWPFMIKSFFRPRKRRNKKDD